MGRQKLSQQQRMEVCDRYQQGESTTQLAKVFEVSPSGINNILKDAGIPRRGPREAQLGVPKAKHSEVCERYLAGESAIQLGKVFGVHSATIRSILKDAGIPRRSPGEYQIAIPKAKHPEICDRYQQGENLTQLGKAFGVHTSTIYRILEDAGVPRRGHSEANGGVPKAKHPEICDRYQQGESTYQLAKVFGVSSSSISYVLKKAGVPRRGRGKDKRSDQQEAA